MGKQCGGYPSPHPSKTTVSNRSSPDLPTPEWQLAWLPGSPKERRAIEFFYHRTAPQLSGLFSHSFWGLIVFQLSICEPAIRHAMIAVSTIHEAAEETDIRATYLANPIATHNEKAKLAFISYSKAIHFLIEEIQRTNTEHSLRIPLTACMMLICAEFMRGSIIGGITHIENGVRILQSWRENRISSPKNNAEEEYIETQLAPYFAAFNVIGAIFGRPSKGIYSKSFQSMEHVGAFRFSDLVEARNTLLDIFNVGLGVIQSTGPAQSWIDATGEQKAEQLHIMVLVSEWNTAFEELAKRCTPNWSPTDFAGADLLRVSYLTTRLWFKTAFNPNETKWDKHKDDFEKLLEITERLAMALAKPEKQAPAFSFEMGFIPPLHFIACKCRWPSIRRRALSLLDNCKRRECLFDSQFSHSVFLRIMQVEEEPLGLSPGEEPQPDALPPEESRIHQINIRLEESKKNVIPIDLLSKPDGLLGKWHIRREYIQVGKPETRISASPSDCKDLIEEVDGESRNASPAPPHFETTPGNFTSAGMTSKSVDLPDLASENSSLFTGLSGNTAQYMGLHYPHHIIDDSISQEQNSSIVE